MLNEKNAIVIAIANCKGGVAKTASTAAIGGSLAHRGNRVLFVDLDCQGNLSHQCMESVPLDKVAANIFAERKVPTVKVTDYIDIVPTDDSLNEVEHRFTSSDERFILTKVLRKVSSNYDYILFDCPPALNWITLECLCGGGSDYRPDEGRQGFAGRLVDGQHILLCRRRQ